MKHKRLIAGFCAKCQADKEMDVYIDDNKEMVCVCPDCQGFVKMPTQKRELALKLLAKEKKLNKRYDIITKN